MRRAPGSRRDAEPMIKLDDSHGDLAAAYRGVPSAPRADHPLRPGDIREISRSRLRIPTRPADVPPSRRRAHPGSRRRRDGPPQPLRIFAQRPSALRVARARASPDEAGDVDVTARELSDLAQVCIEIALAEAQRWAEARFGKPINESGEPCAITIFGMGKLGGRELNCGSDVDLIPFYETDDGTVQKDGGAVEQTLHEHFARVTQRFTATLEDVTEDGLCWRVDLRLRPEGSRGPLVNALAAAERYYLETRGRNSGSAQRCFARGPSPETRRSGSALSTRSPASCGGKRSIRGSRTRWRSSSFGRGPSSPTTRSAT